MDNDFLSPEDRLRLTAISEEDYRRADEMLEKSALAWFEWEMWGVQGY
jgi:protein tyrosine/serine phosphatase